MVTFRADSSSIGLEDESDANRPLAPRGRCVGGPGKQAMASGAWRGYCLRALYTLGIASLSYLLGAAVVYFKLPTSGLLDDAFLGGQAWSERRKEANRHVDLVIPPVTIAVDQPSKAFDGYTAYSVDRGAQAFLINMRGEIVHRWTTRFSELWPKPPHVGNPVEDGHAYFFDCHVYPNGDLLTVFHGNGDTPYGYGLAKLDKNSKVVWTYSANVHHSVDVDDDGVIYVLTQELVRETPKGLEWLSTPCLLDSLVLLSPEGKELDRIPILEAFRDSPYAALLARPDGRLGEGWDVLHTNRASVLRKSMAPHFPRFRAGSVLISVRQLDTIGVIDIESRKVTWAARGPWRGQHDPQFLDNGHLLIFDNRGFGSQSRVLEYDPDTQACPWVYARDESTAFMSPIQGRAQRLGNGNTLIVNSIAGDLYEVSPKQELVWSARCEVHVPWARRYSPSDVPFVQGALHARP